LSVEINDNYLLYQKLENIEIKLDKGDEFLMGMRTEMNNNFKELKNLLEILIFKISEYHPELNTSNKKNNLTVL